jgi:hypothetical protein
MATKSTVAGQHEDFENSKAGIRAFLQGLRRALGPEGMLEETFVEKLAVILWRHRRLRQAENGDLAKNVEE